MATRRIYGALGDLKTLVGSMIRTPFPKSMTRELSPQKLDNEAVQISDYADAEAAWLSGSWRF